MEAPTKTSGGGKATPRTFKGKSLAERGKETEKEKEREPPVFGEDIHSGGDIRVRTVLPAIKSCGVAYRGILRCVRFWVCR